MRVCLCLCVYMYPYLISEGFVFFACELSLCVSGCWSSDFDCPLSLFPPLPSSSTPAVTPCSYNHVNGTLDEDEKIEPTPIIIFEVCVSEGEKEGGRGRACYIMKFLVVNVCIRMLLVVNVCM